MAAWEVYPELTETLIALSEEPTVLTIDSLHMERLELLAVIMYSKSLGCSRVNDARCQLFTHGTRMLDHIPPTQAALFQHARRRCCRQPLCGGKLKHVPDNLAMGLDAREDNQKLGAILDRAV